MPSASSHPPLRTPWVFALSLAQLISWGSVYYVFALIVEPVEAELGLARWQSALAFSLALLVEGLLAYPVGRWIERGHERRVMTLGSLLAGAAMAAHQWVQGLWGFFGLWMLLGAAMSAVLYTPVFAVVTRRFPSDFRRAIIILTFLGGLASTVFVPVGAWLVAHWGWRDALLAVSVLHFGVCAPLHAWLLRGAAPVRAHGAGAGALLHPVAESAQQRTPLGPLLRTPVFLHLAGFTLLMTMATAALPAHMIALLREHGLPSLWVVAVPALIGAFQVLGRVLLFVFEQRWDVHHANRWIPALIPLGLLALLASPWWGPAHQALVLLFVLLFGMGNGMLTIVKGTAMAQYVSQAHVATLNGALGLPLALARAAAPLLLGALWSWWGSYALGLLWVLACTSAGVWALATAQRHALRP
ncbi:MAG: MFS transporter [Rhodoferax sp.]